MMKDAWIFGSSSLWNDEVDRDFNSTSLIYTDIMSDNIIQTSQTYNFRPVEHSHIGQGRNLRFSDA